MGKSKDHQDKATVKSVSPQLGNRQEEQAEFDRDLALELAQERDRAEKAKRGRLLWLAVGIVLIAANLRGALTTVGPVVGRIKDDLGLSGAGAGMLTTLGLIAFAVIAPVAPKLSRRFGAENVLLAGMALITAGVIVRAAPNSALLFVGTALIGLGIGVGNVLVPALIKRDFASRAGSMTGIYSVALTLVAGIASGVSIPIADTPGFGWRGALGVWGIASALAMIAWLPQVSRGRRERADRRQQSPAIRLWRSPLAWQVTFYMGFQSIIFYVNVTWLPELLQDRGMSAGTAGWMLSLMQIIGLPANFLAPVLAARRPSQRGIMAVVIAMLLVGYAGLFFDTAAGPLTALWVILIGIGAGASFSLCLVLFALRTRTAAEATELSGMAQSVGYLVAAVGPAFIGFVHDRTGGWQAPLGVMLGVVALTLVFGLGSSRAAYVSSSSAPVSADPTNADTK
ncbi:CynX/NimT family MFS transporter [Cohnella sp. JJ-181]|uniref:CynX/NimT family MFS transporter n=1 Tax=Cohnella rhizoplanae TaxID=2974897 RepID=UPI0022FFC083|nr:MFS transporter [Cohnella sp. JJ-181]CAI6081524.1 putative transporter YycB [Cohnella sp. JJ-181]